MALKNGTSHVPGFFTLVLHTHLPWVKHHGKWPVGEEWLYQAWAESYIPVFSVLEELSASGYQDMLSIGLTPVLAAQLDDPYTLAGMHHWLGNFLLRSDEAIKTREKPADSPHSLSAADLSQYGLYSYAIAQKTLHTFEEKYLHGGTAFIQKLVANNAFELLSGPLTHPFQPLIPPVLRDFALRYGLEDTRMRMKQLGGGIWAPECAYTPGMEKLYEKLGVTHFVVDGPSFQHHTTEGRTIADSHVVAFARDMEISYQVWSPTSGYPGHPHYRDFYTFDKNTGLKPVKVTGKDVSPIDKKMYDPCAASHTLDLHVDSFVTSVRNKIYKEYERTQKPVHIVAAFDTELFGHWWHEGPQWLKRLIQAMPQAGIPMISLQTALRKGLVGESIDLGEVSWGTGKDFSVWNGPQVHDIQQLNNEIIHTACETIAKRQSVHPYKDIVSDQILRETLLTLSSDWAFLITKQTGAQYARDRVYKHAHALREICHASEIGDEEEAQRLALAWGYADNAFTHLDARNLHL